MAAWYTGIEEGLAHTIISELIPSLHARGGCEGPVPCSQPLHVPALVPPLAFVESVNLPIMLSGGLPWLADWEGGSCCLGRVGCVRPERYLAGSLPSGLRSSLRHIGETSYIGISV